VITNVKAHHYMIAIRTQTSGCEGDSDTTLRMESWFAPIKASLNCPERYSSVARTLPSPTSHGCDVSYEMRGDVTGLRDVFSNMLVKQVLYQGDKPIMTRELREHSTAKLDDSLFDVPSDYKLVTDDEFTKQQSTAEWPADTAARQQQPSPRL
jgi:hypothetical protein